MKMWAMLVVLLAALLAAGCGVPAHPVSPAVPDPTHTTVKSTTALSSLVPIATVRPTITAAATSTLRPTQAPTSAPTQTPLPTQTPTFVPTPTVTQGPTPDGVSRTLRVPILMYHYVSDPPDAADVYRRDLSITPARFESHLKYLVDAGYHVITLDDLLYALTQGRELPAKPVILTFDDGYGDNYTNAFPLLQKYNVVGHFFIISDFVNQERAGYMTWPQIEEMAAAGQRFGSHSRDHPNLSGQSDDYLVWQALGGKEALEDHLGQHPRWISYPAGKYDARTVAV
jgi:hypothetical protein